MSKILKSPNFDPTPIHAGKNKSIAPITPDDGTVVIQAKPQPALPKDPQAEAEAILASAKAEAEQLLAQAQNDVDKIYADAKKEGWEEGYAEGKATGETELESIIADIQKVSESTVEAHNKLLAQSKADMGTIALAATKKILTETLTVQPDIIAEIVAEVIEEASIHGECYVRVNPKDFAILQPHWKAVAHLQQPDSTWELIPDKRVSRGGCMIDIEGGTIDARLQTKISQIETALSQVVN